MDNIKNLTNDELIEVYKIIEEYINFLTTEIENFENLEDKK